jgi:hypothetical protein
MLTGEVKQRLIAVLSEMVARHQRARAQVTEAVCNLLDPSCYIGKDYIELQLVSVTFINTLLCPHTSAPILIIFTYAPEKIEQTLCLMFIVSCIA